jgi:hypothetical protein
MSEMPLYDVFVYCNDCRKEHPMGMIYRIDYGPVQKRSLGDIYQGQPLSPQVQAIEAHKTLCPKNGNMFIQKDHEKIFLVPTHQSFIPNYP